jgi:Galactose oxidase, central domain
MYTFTIYFYSDQSLNKMMRIIYRKSHTFFLFLFLILSYTNIFAQINSGSQWTWMKGNYRTVNFPVYGTQGISSDANIMGARKGAAKWKDASGNMWLYGGEGNGFDVEGLLADLWKYNPSTNQWTWIKGSKTTKQLPVFGVKGVAASSNSPGARSFAASWTDNAGNLWLFGGNMYNAIGPFNTSADFINDLWKYDIATNMWTWVSGDNIVAQAGVYGTQGTPAAANKPGARSRAVTWADTSGNLWLGYGASAKSDEGTNSFNDLWKYNIATNMWTWMKGSNTIGQAGVYGTAGIANAANKPGGKILAGSWIDAAGKFWLFGGRDEGYSTLPSQRNDLWKYDPLTNNWTWMKGSNVITPSAFFGTMGVANINNTPGSKESMLTWSDNNGNLWLFGGQGVGTNTGLYNDLWKYNIATNQWTWMKGNQTANQNSTYGSFNVAAVSNTPGGRTGSFSFIANNGDLYLMGGKTRTGGEIIRNDLWKYIPASNLWVWINGDDKYLTESKYVTIGVTSNSNNPGYRNANITWNDASGNLWLYGGYGNDSILPYQYTLMNNLWKYDTNINQWTWMQGDAAGDQYGVYGTQGVPAVTNKPGGRKNSASWQDAQGNIWMFGGSGYFLNNSIEGLSNELWKYDITSGIWTWMKGENIPNKKGIYGTQGVSSITNTPGSRSECFTWKDTLGNLWLYGGYGYMEAVFQSDPTICSDLWRYNIASNEWTWMGGSNVVPETTVYGTQGIADASNRPGPRSSTEGSWTDNVGNFWFFSGGIYDDIWKYNLSSGLWTWVKGGIQQGQPVFGSIGVAAPNNTPGKTMSAKIFKDSYERVWHFSGNRFFNYDMTNNIWKWVKGDSSSNQYGVYGTQGITAATNKPGTRLDVTTWFDATGKLWLFSGRGSSSNVGGPERGTVFYPESQPVATLDDMWQLGIGPPDTSLIQLCGNGSAFINSNLSGTSYQWQQYNGSSFANISNSSHVSGTNTATLVLTNIPALWQNNLFRCKVNGTQSSDFYKVNIEAFVWTGMINNLWSNPGNWSCGRLPDGDTDVFVNSGTVEVDVNSICGTLHVTPGVVLTINSGVTLTIVH